jgi:hypothetical protein
MYRCDLNLLRVKLREKKKLTATNSISLRLLLNPMAISG